MVVRVVIYFASPQVLYKYKCNGAWMYRYCYKCDEMRFGCFANFNMHTCVEILLKILLFQGTPVPWYPGTICMHTWGIGVWRLNGDLQLHSYIVRSLTLVGDHTIVHRCFISFYRNSSTIVLNTIVQFVVFLLIRLGTGVDWHTRR
jgi:uncharacterized RDD family membrane protein YckC